MKRAGLTAAAVLMVISGSSWADALQCDSSIVETGASAQELVAQCGEPVSKSIEGMNWTYHINGGTYEVRMSDSGVVAEIKQVDQ